MGGITTGQQLTESFTGVFIMTKKKEPHELKKRGRKETVHQNHDLRSHLAGVKKSKSVNQCCTERYQGTYRCYDKIKRF